MKRGPWLRPQRRADREVVERDRSDRAAGRELRSAHACARHWADHLQRDGGRDRRGGRSSTSEMSHSRRFDQWPITSALPRLADIFRAGWHVSKVPTATATVALHKGLSQTSPRSNVRCPAQRWRCHRTEESEVLRKFGLLDVNADNQRAARRAGRAGFYHNRHRKNASMIRTAAPMAKPPSALMVAPQRSMNNLSDMRGSPLKQ